MSQYRSRQWLEDEFHNHGIFLYEVRIYKDFNFEILEIISLFMTDYSFHGNLTIIRIDVCNTIFNIHFEFDKTFFFTLKPRYIAVLNEIYLCKMKYIERL